MILKELNALIKPVTVAEEYDDSSDFDAAMGQVNNHLLAARKIITSPDWEQYLEDTDQHLDTSAVQRAEEAKELLEKTIDAYAALYDHMADV